MNITSNIENDGKSALLVLEGRIDTVTAVDLEKAIAECSAASEMVLDFEKVDYISSAGLRVILATHKAFSSKAGLSLINVCDAILNIFEVTGFKDIINIR